jgi:hypothetical protein
MIKSPILIVTDRVDFGVHLVKPFNAKGYNIELCTLSAVFEKVSDSTPDIIVWLFLKYPPENLHEYMLKISDIYDENERPFNLLGCKASLFDHKYDYLIDAWESTPVSVPSLEDKIDRLLRKKMS